MSWNFYQYAVDLMGTLPAGYDFIYVLVALLLFGMAMFLFLVLPLAILVKVGSY